MIDDLPRNKNTQKKGIRLNFAKFRRCFIIKFFQAKNPRYTVVVFFDSWAARSVTALAKERGIFRVRAM